MVTCTILKLVLTSSDFDTAAGDCVVEDEVDETIE